MTRWLVLTGMVWICALALAGGQAGRSSFPGTIDQHAAIDYRGTAAADSVTRVALGGLAFDGTQGYLRSVLAALDIPIESQVLLFSKTGIQHAFTNPQNPRATRLLRYRCSYMVYAPAFTALPDAARAAVIARMKEILIARKDVVASAILSETAVGWP